MNNQYTVDVVIPTYKPDEKFLKLIHRLKKQDYPLQHIYVINTMSGHFPKEVEQMPGVVVTQIPQEEFDHGATRDKGMQMSDAEVVVFMTQDAVPADHQVIRKLVEALMQSEKIGISYARQLPAEDCDYIERFTRKFNYPESSVIKGKDDIERMGIKAFFCSDVCAAYRKDIYEKTGGFCKRTIFNEDMILAGHMVMEGYLVAYAAEARVIHSHNYSGIQQFHRNFDLAVSQTDHPEVFKMVHSESEGIKLVKDTVLHLLKVKRAYLIPALIYKSGCKFLGYKMGQNYKKMPLWMIKKCSMNKTYWGNT
ncbi:MAG: glycosyltransferase family 2 protein [Dorea sp.]|nr:glycosyltransferase family 2 protein [Dorea sp.]